VEITITDGCLVRSAGTDSRTPLWFIHGFPDSSFAQDLAVRPEYRGRDIGRRIVCRLMSAIGKMAPGAPFIGVFATPEAVPLYRTLGLDRTLGGLTGMAAVKAPGDIDRVCADLG
jgi:GNAT superfamily N-acetyltransferase